MKIKSLYIASLEPSAGSLIITTGLMEILGRTVDKIAFFRPIVVSEEDADIRFVLEHFSLKQPKESTYGVTLAEAEHMIASGRRHDLMELLIGKVRQLEEAYGFVLCEGLPRTTFTKTIDFDINIEIARNLSSSFVSVLSGRGRDAEAIGDEVRIEEETIGEEGCDHFATFVNRIDPTLLEKLTFAEGKVPCYLLPEVPELDMPSMQEVMEALGCDLISGKRADLKRVVRQKKVAAMQLEHFLEHLEDGDLVITPGDRDDIILGTIVANYSRFFPSIAGILVTGGFRPGENLLQLIGGIKHYSLPVLLTSGDTYDTVERVKKIPSKMRPDSERKIALAKGIFRTHVDTGSIEARIDAEGSDTVTPIMFGYGLFEKARHDKRRIVLPESGDERILRAVEILLRRDVVTITLLGDRDEVMRRAAELGLDIAGADIVDPADSPLLDEFARDFYEMRRHKGISMEDAREAMLQVSYFGTMMVHKGKADGMVSGAVHTTQETIRPALQIIKTKPGISIVSSVFFMCLETRVLVYGDCAVNLDPNAGELAQIALSSAETASAFGIEPKIALLSYSTGSSGKGDDVEKVREATRIAREQRPDLAIEGPIQYDAAIDPDVARQKLPDSPVAGKASVFVFPDLNTGNNTYKAVQRSSGAVAIGPVLQGLNKPVNDLSRGCLVEDIVNTVAITAIQSQGERQ